MDLEFMTTSFKTFYGFASALDLFSFCYWKLVQHAAQGEEQKCSTLDQRCNEIITHSHLACKRVPSHSKDYLVYCALSASFPTAFLILPTSIRVSITQQKHVTCFAFLKHHTFMKLKIPEDFLVISFLETCSSFTST